jgi:hypothetical protein
LTERKINNKIKHAFTDKVSKAGTSIGDGDTQDLQESKVSKAGTSIGNGESQFYTAYGE